MRILNLNKLSKKDIIGVVAQLVERLICIQEAWGSTPHNSIFLFLTLLSFLNVFKYLTIFLKKGTKKVNNIIN